MLDKIDDVLDKTIGIAEDKIYSRKQAEEDRTDRLRIDNTSLFKLPHLIRPIAFIWAMSLQTILSIIVVIKSHEHIFEVMSLNTVILTSIVGFYFTSRKQEKIVAKKAIAAIAIKKEEVKQDRVRERREFRLQRIKERKK